MSLTSLTPSKGHQPAVLQLLPFSKNNAGVSIPSVSVSGGSNRAFPALAVTRNQPARLRSKSASVAMAGSTKHLTASQAKSARIIRASSEKWARGKPNQIHTNQSKAELSQTNRLVKCSVRDINDSVVSKEPSLEGTNEPNKFLPKPALKVSEGRWSGHHVRFWKSSSNTEFTEATYKPQFKLDVDMPPSKLPKRVKMNVNELPRSQSPICENDPDKLNMKHVIAFLQSSSHSENVSNEPTNQTSSSSVQMIENGRIPGRHYVVKTEAVLSNKENKKQQMPSKHPGTEADKGSRQSHGRPSESPSIDQGRHGRSFENPNIERGRITKQWHGRPSESLNTEQSRQGRPLESLNAEQGIYGRLSESPDIERVRDTIHPYGKLSFSPDIEAMRELHNTLVHDKKVQIFNTTPDPNGVYIPENIRKIRDSEACSKPFRLHRFLTLVPNGSESLLNSAQRKPSRNTPTKTRRENTPAITTRNTSAGRRVLLSRRDEAAQVNSLVSEILSADIDSEKRRAVLTDQPVRRVIRLPLAQLEADSDEDTLSQCTVPNARNSTALTLSAQGRAIRREAKSAHFAVRGCGELPVENNHRPTIVPDGQKSVATRHVAGGNSDSRCVSDRLSMNRHHTRSPMSNKTETSQSVKSETPVSDLPEWAKTDQSPSGHHSGSQCTGHVTGTAENEAFFKTPHVDRGSSQNDGGSSQADGGPSPLDGGSSPDSTSKHQVRLSLRKERIRTRELTYMVDMAD